MHIITRDRVVHSFSRDRGPVGEVNIIYGLIEIKLGVSRP